MEQTMGVQEIPKQSSSLTWKTKILQALETLNLFETEANDSETIRRQRWSTRLYLVLFSSFMIILIIYAMFSSCTINVVVSQPREDEFKQLSTLYPETLQCPCSQVAMQYSEIAYSELSFHEVCLSTFVSQQYIDAIYGGNVSFISPVDVRTIMSAFWQLIRSFCDISKNTWSDAYTNFNATLLISPIAQSQLLIETQVNNSLDFSFASAVNNLKRNLLIARDTTLANGLISGLATNYYVNHTSTSSSSSVLEIVPNVFDDGCSCSNANGCLRPAVILESNAALNVTEVPGMMFNCLPMDGVLASTFECYYDSACLSLVQQYLSTNERSRPLNALSRFTHNTTIQTLINELMIEQLTTRASFSLYYTLCHPTYCTYSYSRRFDIIFTITLLFSAIGGISLILRVISQLLIAIVWKIRMWKIRGNSVGIDVNQPSLTNRK